MSGFRDPRPRPLVPRRCTLVHDQSTQFATVRHVLVLLCERILRCPVKAKSAAIISHTNRAYEDESGGILESAIASTAGMYSINDYSTIVRCQLDRMCCITSIYAWKMKRSSITILAVTMPEALRM